MTTWSTTDKSSTITLSNGNLTAVSSTAVSQSVRSTTSKSAGKVYWEVTINVTSNDVAIGIANSSEALNVSGGIGADANAMGFYAVSPPQATYVNSAALNEDVTASAAGEVVSLAVNFGTSPPTAWLLTSKMVGWNNSTTASPSTSTGGITLTGLNAGPYFAIFNDDKGGAQVTANFGGSAFTRSVPTGFSAWDTATTITGTLTETQASQTLSGAGQVLISGGLTATQGSQTLYGAASVVVAGSLTATQGTQTLSSAGTVVSGADTATLAVTQASQTVSGSASVIVGGTLAVTQGAQTLAGTASVVVTGTLSETQAPNTPTITAIYAQLTQTQAAQTLTGTAKGAITATLNVTQAPQTPPPRPTVPVSQQLNRGTFTSLPPPIIQGGGDVYAQREVQRMNSAMQELLIQIPQAATKPPTRPVDGMVRLSRWPWWPLTGQAGDAWVFYDGTTGAWVHAGWTTPTSTGGA